MLPEIFKEIKEYPMYEVSNYGSVRTWKKRPSGRAEHPSRMKDKVSNNGYKLIGLRNGSQKNKLVHRLVLGAFVGPCPEGMEACHNDGNRLNNRLENLRWDTKKNNNADKKKHGTDGGLKGEMNGYAKLKEGDVLEIRRLCDAGAKQRDISEMFKVSQPTVNLITKRKLWSHLK